MTGALTVDLTDGDIVLNTIEGYEVGPAIVLYNPVDDQKFAIMYGEGYPLDTYILDADDNILANPIYFDGDTFSLECDLDVENIAAVDLALTGDIGSNLIPDGDATRDLGSTSFLWDDAYIDNLHVKSEVTVQCDILPLTDITYDLGSSTKKWYDVRCSRLYALGLYCDEKRGGLAFYPDALQDLGTSGDPWSDVYAQGIIYTDDILEITSDQGVTIEGIQFIDNTIALGSFASPQGYTTAGGDTVIHIHTRHTTNALTGTHRGTRFRSSVGIDSASGTLYTVVLQGANVDGVDISNITTLLAESIGKSDTTSATITTMRAGLFNSEWGVKDTITTLTTLHVRTHTLNATGEGSFGTGYLLYIENEAVGGNGQALDAMVLLKGTNLGGSINVADYGIDMNLQSGHEFTTAAIRSQGHIIPKTDDSYDLGTTSLKWKDLYLDGVAYLDAVEMAGILDMKGQRLRFGTSAYAINNVDIYWTGDQTLAIVNAGGTTKRDLRVSALYFSFLNSLATNLNINTMVIGTATLNLNVPDGAGGYRTVAQGRQSGGVSMLDIPLGGDITLQSGKTLSARASNFGDGGTTNYAAFATDGELTLYGTARVLGANWIGAEGLKAPGVKPATQVDLGISIAWEFSDATDDTIVANFRIPNKMDRTVAPTLRLAWSCPTADPGDDSVQCVWQVEYLWRASGEDVTAAAEGTLTVTTSASTSTDGLVISSVTLTAPSATDECIHLRIKRLGADASDTLGDVAHLTGICKPFTSDKLGTAT